jgi:DNA-binding transcriptional regulator YbjK
LITDAAIDILANVGARGLSHRAIDLKAGLPPGTTSNYFKTSYQLLEAAGRRLAELHWRAVFTLRDEIGDRLSRQQLAAILERIVTAADPEVRVRHLARRSGRVWRVGV